MNEAETADVVARIKAACVELRTYADEAFKGQLPAMRIGAALIEARQRVEQEGGKWKVWVDANLEGWCSYRSALDYILTAEHPEISQSSASILDALKKIRTQREADGTARKKPAPRKQKQAIDKPNASESTASNDLATALDPGAVAVDEVVAAFGHAKWEPADLREIARGISDGDIEAEHVPANSFKSHVERDSHA